MTVKGFTWSFGSYIAFELNGYYYYLQSGSNPLIGNNLMKTKIFHKDGKDRIQSVYLDDLDDVCSPTLTALRYAGGKPFYAVYCRLQGNRGLKKERANLPSFLF